MVCIISQATHHHDDALMMRSDAQSPKSTIMHSGAQSSTSMNRKGQSASIMHNGAQSASIMLQKKAPMFKHEDLTPMGCEEMLLAIAVEAPPVPPNQHGQHIMVRATPTKAKPRLAKATPPKAQVPSRSKAKCHHEAQICFSIAYHKRANALKKEGLPTPEVKRLAKEAAHAALAEFKASEASGAS